MLTFIKTALETILSTLQTNITNVVVQQTNSLEKGLNKPEPNLLQIVYRKNNGEVSTIKAKDRYVSGVLYFLALEEEKAVLEEMWEIFLETYNRTLQTDRTIYAGELSPFGIAENIGAKTYQMYAAIFDVQIVDSIGTLANISVTINNETINAESGLLSCVHGHAWVLAEAPISQYLELKRRYKVRTIELSVLDIENDFTDLIKTYLFDDIPKATITITDGTTSTTFTGEIAITHSSQQKAFNSYQITIRRG